MVFLKFCTHNNYYNLCQRYKLVSMFQFFFFFQFHCSDFHVIYGTETSCPKRGSRDRKYWNWNLQLPQKLAYSLVRNFYSLG